MLREIQNDRLTVERRRWFTDEDMDLYVWHDAGGAVSGFQVCFDKNSYERTFTWLPPSYSSLAAVDSGEQTPLKNMAPILVPAHECAPYALREQFAARSQGLETSLRDFVLNCIERSANQAL